MDREEQVRINRFYNHYRRFVSRSIDPKKYKVLLNNVHKMTEEIDFNSNLIICHPKMIDREVFLSGFSRLETYKSFHYMNVGELKDIFFSYSRENELPSSADYSSTNQLNNDVLCLTLNAYESKPKSGFLVDICLEVVMRRAFSNTDKLNWLFFRGSLDILRMDYGALFTAFKDSASHHKFFIIDLGGNKVQIFNADKQGSTIYSDFDL